MKKISVALFLVLLTVTLIGEDYQVGDLSKGMQYGAYQVGFKTVQAYDFSRVFENIGDKSLNQVAGNPRPIQINIWYPAYVRKNDQVMKYNDYFKTTITELNFNSKDVDLFQKNVDEYLKMFDESESSILLSKAMLNSDTRSYYKAKEVEERFQLILYTPGGGERAFENFSLIEYLVSHGYIVASVASIGSQSKEIKLDWLDLESSLRDMQFVYSYMRQQRNVNADRIGLIGFCMGSGVNNLFASRNPYVKAIISFYNELSQENQRKIVNNQRPLAYLNRDLKVLSFDIINNKNRDNYYFENVLYHDILLFRLHNMSYQVFTSYYLHKLSPLPQLKDKTVVYQETYQLICQRSLEFLNMNFGTEKMDWPLASVHQDSSLSQVSIAFKEGVLFPPTDDRFFRWMELNGFEKSMELVNASVKRDPLLKLFDETQMNLYGYNLIKKKDYTSALSVMKLNCVMYPDSFNAFDSLAEAYYMKGEMEEAIKNYEESLKLNIENDNARKMIKKIQDSQVQTERAEE